MKEKIIKISWGKTSDGKVINVNDAPGVRIVVA